MLRARTLDVAQRPRPANCARTLAPCFAADSARRSSIMTAAECLPSPHLMCTAAHPQSAMAAADGDVNFQSREPQALTSARVSHCGRQASPLTQAGACIKSCIEDRSIRSLTLAHFLCLFQRNNRSSKPPLLLARCLFLSWHARRRTMSPRCSCRVRSKTTVCASTHLHVTEHLRHRLERGCCCIVNRAIKP